MIHELCSLVREFPIGSLIVILSCLWAGGRVVTSFINRNKPDVDCERDCECDCDEEEEEEVVAMGGETSEHKDQQ